MLLFNEVVTNETNLIAEDLPTILLVDDDSLVSTTVSKVLSEEKFRVLIAENGLEAVDVLHREKIDLIICDIMMPEMDGYQLQSELNKFVNLQNIPFIFLSACDDQESRMRGVEAGADAFLRKPFEANELISTVKGRLKRLDARRRHISQEKEQFSKDIIRHLSHELRTPLLAVNAGSEMLNTQIAELSTDHVGDLIKSIWRGGKRLENLVNNFILIQQIQSGQAKKYYDRNCVTFDIGEFLDEYIKLKTKELSNQGYQFEVNLGDLNGYLINACPNQLVQVLDRIFDNAMKFDQTVRSIKFSAEVENQQLVMSVVDSGNGFDPACLGRITSAFYQHNREKEEQQGGGLGLTICKLLTRQNKGRIGFSSIEKGAQVNLSFPLAK